MSNTTFINLTPHEITIRVGVFVLALPPAEKSARLVGSSLSLSSLSVEIPSPSTSNLEIPLVRRRAPREIEGLPPPKDGVVYITSLLVAEAAATLGRTDVCAPGTGPDDEAVRENGRVVAVTRLVQIEPEPEPEVDLWLVQTINHDSPWGARDLLNVCRSREAAERLAEGWRNGTTQPHHLLPHQKEHVEVTRWGKLR